MCHAYGNNSLLQHLNSSEDSDFKTPFDLARSRDTILIEDVEED